MQPHKVTFPIDRHTQTNTGDIRRWSNWFNSEEERVFIDVRLDCPLVVNVHSSLVSTHLHCYWSEPGTSSTNNKIVLLFDTAEHQSWRKQMPQELYSFYIKADDACAWVFLRVEWKSKIKNQDNMTHYSRIRPCVRLICPHGFNKCKCCLEV